MHQSNHDNNNLSHKDEFVSNNKVKERCLIKLSLLHLLVLVIRNVDHTAFDILFESTENRQFPDHGVLSGPCLPFPVEGWGRSEEDPFQTTYVQ